MAEPRAQFGLTLIGGFSKPGIEEPPLYHQSRLETSSPPDPAIVMLSHVPNLI